MMVLGLAPVFAAYGAILIYQFALVYRLTINLYSKGDGWHQRLSWPKRGQIAERTSTYQDRLWGFAKQVEEIHGIFDHVLRFGSI